MNLPRPGWLRSGLPNQCLLKKERIFFLLQVIVPYQEAPPESSETFLSAP